MKASTQLYASEGRDNVAATLKVVAKAANTFDIGAIVIFASSAENVLKLRDLIDESRGVTAVTFPAGFTATVGDSPAFVGIPSAEDRQRLADARVAVVQGVMPFRALGDTEMEGTRMFRRALDLFGGGMQLCVQAVLMACDAGAIQAGKRCIAMTADTAIVAHAEHAFRFLSNQSRFSVEHILCKPVAYSITRPSVIAPTEPGPATAIAAGPQAVLPTPAVNGD